jgi:protein TonB
MRPAAAFLAALFIHMLFLRSCDLHVQKPAVSIVNQEISITLDHIEPATDNEPKQQLQKSKESEPEQVQEIKQEKVEQEGEKFPSTEVNRVSERVEIKEIKTPAQVDSVKEPVKEDRLEAVEETVLGPEKIFEEQLKDEQERSSEIQESFVEEEENSSSLSSRVIEAVPLYKRNPPPVYPRRAKRRGYEGVVVLEILVNKQGRPAEIKIVTSSGYGVLDRAAERAVRQWVFEPATRGEEKIAMWVQVPVRFQLTEIKK